MRREIEEAAEEKICECKLFLGKMKSTEEEAEEGVEEIVGRQRATSIPEPVFTLFAFLARQGVHISDLFRRPGNINQMKVRFYKLAKITDNKMVSTDL